MQIRPRGKKLEFLRSIYDPEKKRCRQKLLGSQDSWKAELTDAVRKKLTEEEIVEAEEYFAKKQEERNKSCQWVAVVEGSTKIKEIAEAIPAVEENTLTEPRATAIYKAIDELEKALRKKGFSKAAALKKKPAKKATDKKPAAKKKATAKKK